jgi:8-amino-7-oxononanoate synthase
MLDFTSSLYLGLTHPSASLPRWENLTTGAPAVLATPPGATEIAHRLAVLQGCEAALPFPSTLHAFWDVCGALSRRRVSMFVDAGTYPVARWGTERALARSVPVAAFDHHSPAALERLLAAGDAGRVPVVLTDGFCTSCGRAAPLAAYLSRVQARGGWLVVDDTQALGVLGAPRLGSAYGHGGGGSLRAQGLSSPHLVVVASLAKAFGAPMAAVSGARDVLRSLLHASETRVHASPVSAASLGAARGALDVNDSRGDALRRRLLENVIVFRRALAAVGCSARGDRFPVQTLDEPRGASARDVHDRLLGGGVRTVLRSSGCDGRHGARVAFVLTAAMTPTRVRQAVRILARSIERPQKGGLSTTRMVR